MNVDINVDMSGYWMILVDMNVYFTLAWAQNIFLYYLILSAQLEPQLLDIAGIT